MWWGYPQPILAVEGAVVPQSGLGVGAFQSWPEGAPILAGGHLGATQRTRTSIGVATYRSVQPETRVSLLEGTLNKRLGCPPVNWQNKNITFPILQIQTVNIIFSDVSVG